MASSPQTLRLSLIENAYDSLAESLGYVERSKADLTQWKFALLNLVHTVELVLKQRLLNEHALLIWQDVDQPGRRTVGAEKALRRLEIAGVSLEPREVKVVRTALAWRNSITHYEVDLVLDEVREHYLLIFEFLDKFHLAHLGTAITSHISEASLPTAAELARSFQREFIEFQGETMHRSWPHTLLAAQQILTLSVDEVIYQRLRWGAEGYWKHPDSYPHSDQPCPDCSTRSGDFHGPCCDMEECPIDGAQLLTCDHDFNSRELWELEEDEVQDLDASRS